MNSRKNWLTVLAVVIAAAGLLMVVLASKCLGEALKVPDPAPIVEVTQAPTPEPLPEPAQIEPETVEEPEAEQVPIEPETVAESQPQPATATESAQGPAEPEPETIVDEPDPEPIEAEPAPEPEQEPEPELTPEPAPAMHLFDRCRITHYCPCAQCCGAAGQATASGVMPQVNHTVANNVLPYGTRVMINGTEYVVEDCGGDSMADGRTFDIFVSDHQTALNLGMYYADVYISED